MQLMAEFLRERREQVLQRLLLRARQLPSAHRLEEAELRDNFPEILDALAHAIEQDDPATLELGTLPTLHSTTRALADYSLGEVVREYGFVRQSILEEYAQHQADEIAAGRCRLSAIALVDQCIDHAIADAVEQYDWRRKGLRDQLVGILAHDLRSPLQTVLLSADVLLRQEHRLGEEQLRVVARITASANRIKQLITDLLDFARTRMGSVLPIALIEADLRRIAIDAIDELCAIHPDRDIRHELLNEPGSFRCMIDVGRIAQALGNLIANALQHGSDPIVLRLHAHDDRVALTICNSGPIAPSIRHSLFEPFETGNPKLGTGLGLYIAREIARAHGGELTATFGDDETTFRLELPRSIPRKTIRAVE